MVSDDFKLLSLNVRGLSNFKKRRAVFTWWRKQKASIIFLQETHSTIDKEKQWAPNGALQQNLPMAVAMQEVLLFCCVTALIAK